MKASDHVSRDEASRPSGPTGATQLRVWLELAAAAWSAMALQELLLFLRPTPYGVPYVQNWWTFIFHALLFNWVAITLVSLPAVGCWVWTLGRKSGARARLFHVGTIVAFAVVLMLDQLDNEIMRFSGTHLSFGLVATYFRIDAWGQAVSAAIVGDAGGPGLPVLILLGVSIAYVLWSRRHLARRIADPPRPPLPLLSAALCTMLMLVPALIYATHSGHFRKIRVRPALLALVAELGQDWRAARPPANYAQLVADYQRDWLAASADPQWRFDDPRRPLLRSPINEQINEQLNEQPATEPWNVIVLQLESLRGWDVGYLRSASRPGPGLGPSPTPYLDSLAADPRAAYWTRHLSFGPPTVSGFMAWQCSIPPHSRHNLITNYTYTQLRCLPELLRARGWTTEFFTASDPDWDNESLWLRRWYDQHHYCRSADEADRAAFRLAAARIRELGRAGPPFMATVVSVTNHIPFHSREPGLDIAGDAHVQERILNTIHYTDDVVREFIEGLREEPWFAHTLIVILGDHGYNLGEHDGTVGRRVGYRENIWVPLIIYGDHPRLVPGRHAEVASLLDVAPSIADLLGIREPVPWVGHTLVRGPRAEAAVTSTQGTMVFAEYREFALVVDPDTGHPALFDVVGDPRQRDDISGHWPALVGRLLERAARETALIDYLIEVDRVWPAPRP